MSRVIPQLAPSGCFLAWSSGIGGFIPNLYRHNGPKFAQTSRGNVSYGSCVTSIAGPNGMRNCTRDEGGPFGFGDRELIPSHRKLLLSKAMVVSVAETPGHDSGRHG